MLLSFCSTVRSKVLLATFAFIFFSIGTIFQAQGFTGLESTSLQPVENIPGDWGLKIVFLNVGQADAILVMTPNGDVVLIDSGKYKSVGEQIANFLESKALNGVGSLNTIDLLYTTHYDSDHIGGLPGLVERNVRIRKAFDQGLSLRRSLTTSSGNRSSYGKYVDAVVIQITT